MNFCKKYEISLGAIHKLRHTLRGGGGRRSVTLCDKGGRILNFVTSHFNTTRINQIETIPLKSIEHCTLNNLTNIGYT